LREVLNVLLYMVQSGFRWETLELQHLSVPKVARLMRQAYIRSEHKKKYKAITDSKHDYPVSENLLDRNFQPG
jgi:hypothetical protein